MELEERFAAEIVRQWVAERAARRVGDLLQWAAAAMFAATAPARAVEFVVAEAAVELFVVQEWAVMVETVKTILPSNLLTGAVLEHWVLELVPVWQVQEHSKFALKA